jgi:hypothetical protein
MLRTHRSLKAYCVTLWWRWKMSFFIFTSNGAPVGWNWQGKIEALGEKPVPVPLCSPQIPHGLTLDRTRTIFKVYFHKHYQGNVLLNYEIFTKSVIITELIKIDFFVSWDLFYFPPLKSDTFQLCLQENYKFNHQYCNNLINYHEWRRGRLAHQYCSHLAGSFLAAATTTTTT